MPAVRLIGIVSPQSETPTTMSWPWLDRSAEILFHKFIPADTLTSLTASIQRATCLSQLDLDWGSAMIGRTLSITGQPCTNLPENRRFQPPSRAQSP